MKIVSLQKTIYRKDVMEDENYQEIMNRDQEVFRFNQDIEQQRIFREMQSEPAPRRRGGWIVVLVFLAVVACAIFAFSAGAQTITFADPEVGLCALRNGDIDGDGVMSKAEADSLKSLNLTSYRTHMFQVKTYEDLALFPNLEKLWLGESHIDTVDLSKNWNLKFVCIQSDNLKAIVLAVGCTPKLAYPMHSGEIIVRRVLNPDAPGAMFFQY